MEFFLEIILTAVVALVFSFVVAKLVSVAMAGRGGGNGSTSESEGKSGCFVGEDVIMQELQFGQKMDAEVFESERNVRVVEESVENVDRFEVEAVRVEELEEAARGSGEIGAERAELAVQAAEAESAAAESPENAVVEAMIGRELEEQSESVEERSDRVKIEERSEPEQSGDVTVAESEEVRAGKSESRAGNEEKIEELDIEEEDDDWEGIERSEMEKAFAAAAKFVEESGEAIGIGTEAKMELYGLHKIATEGSCREPQPMALMVSARAKWNAWQKLGNMSQEEAMEEYLELLSKEIPGWMQESSTGGKKPETETSVNLHPDSSTLEPLPALNTADVASIEQNSKSAAEEGDMNEASNLDNKAKRDVAV